MDSLATLERSRDRLRHPLRVRHLRSGDSRRLAGRDHRQVAALRQPVGDRAPGDHVRREVRRAHRARTATSRAATACAGCPSGSSRASPTTRRCPAIARPTTNLLRLWKAEADRVVRLRRVQRRRLLRRRRREGRVGNDLQGALSERRAGDRASSCGSRSSTSSSPARCRT